MRKSSHSQRKSPQNYLQSRRRSVCRAWGSWGWTSVSAQELISARKSEGAAAFRPLKSGQNIEAA